MPQCFLYLSGCTKPLSQENTSNLLLIEGKLKLSFGFGRIKIMRNKIRFGSIIVGIIITVLIAISINNSKETVQKPARICSLPLTAEILFTSNRDTKNRRAEIYSMDANGGNITRLTFTKEHHFIMGIDRSKRYIVASRAERDTKWPLGLGDEDRRSLWLIDLETKQEMRLTDPRYSAEGDSFSPDGEWVIFMMSLSDKSAPDIYKIKRDGTGLTNLTNTPDTVEGDPTWSHDGKEIVFTYIDGNIRRFILKKMNSDGSNVQTIYDGGPGISTPAFPPGNYDPSWSPDDQWIVFERCVKSTGENWKSGIWHIFKVRRDGSEIVDLSLAGGHIDRAEYLPSYSNDGRFIVFGSLYQAKNPAQSHNDIFIMDTNGNSLKRLTYGPIFNMFPFWIPTRFFEQPDQENISGKQYKADLLSNLGGGLFDKDRATKNN